MKTLFFLNFIIMATTRNEMDRPSFHNPSMLSPGLKGKEAEPLFGLLGTHTRHTVSNNQTKRLRERILYGSDNAQAGWPMRLARLSRVMTTFFSCVAVFRPSN
jgi:hypothetical protein